MKSLQTNEDPLDLFRKIVATEENCFLLETLADKEQPQSSHRSYIGFNPKRVFTASSGQLQIGGKIVASDNPYRELQRYVAADQALGEGYVGGLVGYMAHEAISYLEPSLCFSYGRKFPDFQFGEYQDGIIFKPNKKPSYFYYGKDRSNQIPIGEPAARTKLRIDFQTSGKAKAHYESIVSRAKRDIQNGRVFQVVLANVHRYHYHGDLLNLYERLRQINPSPFMFFIKFGNTITLGASPELLAHTKPGGRVYLEALAGTIRRGKTKREDIDLARKLGSDEKEIAEHSMLVDLARNDVGRVSQIGSVRIDSLMYIKQLSHVQHIASLVSGKLDQQYSMFDSLAASFPAGTLSGAPKIEAIKMINELEAVERGPYGGTIGYFSYNGDSMHAVNIRSVSAAGRSLYLHSGAGIVYDSRPSREYQETNEKKAAMETAMSAFVGGGKK